MLPLWLRHTQYERRLAELAAARSAASAALTRAQHPERRVAELVVLLRTRLIARGAPVPDDAKLEVGRKGAGGEIRTGTRDRPGPRRRGVESRCCMLP